MDKKRKKDKVAGKNEKKVKKLVIDKERTAFKMRKEINELKEQNSQLSQAVSEYKSVRMNRTNS